MAKRMISPPRSEAHYGGPLEDNAASGLTEIFGQPRATPSPRP